MRWQSHQSFRDPSPIQRPAPRGTQPMLADLTQNSHPSVPYGCLGRAGLSPREPVSTRASKAGRVAHR